MTASVAAPMVLTLKEKPRRLLDLAALSPGAPAGGAGRRRIADVKLLLGGEKVRAGELFDVSGEDPENIELRRTTERVTRIGAGMTRGRITVKAHGGNCLGEGMRGGAIRVAGDCGEGPGRRMHWGRIDIDGDAGDRAGEKMHDGLITIWGNAGHRPGNGMRRGLIMTGGDSGDFTGAGMIAGTILVLGRCGRMPGYGMKRGSIILGNPPEKIGATMADCGLLKMEYLRLFFKQLSRMGSRYRFFRKFGPRVQLYAGDLANNGKGELMILLDAGR